MAFRCFLHRTKWRSSCWCSCVCHYTNHTISINFRSWMLHCWSFPLRPCCPNVLFPFPANCKVVIWPKMYRKRHTLHLRQRKHEDFSWWELEITLVKLRMPQFRGGKPWCSPALVCRFFPNSQRRKAEICRNVEAWTKSQAKANPSLALTFTPRFSKVSNFTDEKQHHVTQREMRCLIRLFWLGVKNTGHKPYILLA